MKAINITEKEVQAAFSAAKSEETKQVLTALFGQQKMKPTLDNYKTIKTYEDACEALNLAPIYSDLAKDADRAICQYSEAQRQYGHIMNLPKHILSLMKLEIISRALWGRKWKPEPDTDSSKQFYYPCFALWTKVELNGLNEEQKSAILPIVVDNNKTAGFGYWYSTTISSSNTFRLCQETTEKAEYFGRQFIELWAEYLFNFD